MVYQLNQMPSKISILSLLLCSKTHRNALLKILCSAHVTQDIYVAQFEGIVTNIDVGNCLGFYNDELPVEGKAHSKVLHIFMKCLDTVLSLVLVDTGSSLKVMPKSTLFKLNMDGGNDEAFHPECSSI